MTNLDPQYRANMVPLIFAQEWVHSSIIFDTKCSRYVIFIEKPSDFDPCFCANWQVCEFAPKFTIKLYVRPVILTPVFAQTDRYVSLRNNGPSNYMSDRSSKRLVATGPGPVFKFSPNPCNCNRTDHQRPWTTTAVQSFFGPVQSSLWSFCGPRTGLLNTND